MSKSLSPERRRTVLFSACATVLAALPSLTLMPLRQTHRLSDPPYFMGTGLCIGLSIACLAAAISLMAKHKFTSSASQ